MLSWTTNIKRRTQSYTKFTKNISRRINVTQTHIKCVVCGQRMILQVQSRILNQYNEIEKTFEITLDEDEALVLYDMDLDEAVQRIIEIKRGKC